MGPTEVISPINSNTPLTQIIISKPNAQQTLINTSNIQIRPFINPPNIVVDDIGYITLELGVDLHIMVTNTSSP